MSTWTDEQAFPFYSWDRYSAETPLSAESPDDGDWDYWDDVEEDEAAEQRAAEDAAGVWDTVSDPWAVAQPLDPPF